VLTAHIVVSVGLLGEVSAFLAIAARAAGGDDPAFAATAYDLLAVGVAELRQNLSLVEQGERLVVTDRNRPVAELGPPPTEVPRAIRRAAAPARSRNPRCARLTRSTWPPP
jgi:antitoxin (DNA-binding transcriptional repressor) of toxin-antitoxin stability system